MIPYGKHHIDEEDIKTVTELLRNENLTQGNMVSKFEYSIAEYVGAKYAVAASSCSAGLHLSCIAADMKVGKTACTSPITFASTANAVKHTGGKIILVDIDRETKNIDPSYLESLLKKNEKIDTVIPVHFSGTAADTKRIKEITKDKNIKIIEDAAHALGSHYNDGSKVGCCSNSDMTVFSFHPVKAIATGEGGMITTNDINLCNRLKKLRSHGITKEKDNFLNFTNDQSKSDKNYWYYEMQELGYHYRLTDIQCALGISQLKKIEKFLSKRKKLVLNYDNAFKNLKNCKPIQLNNRLDSSHHLYILEIDFKKIGKSRNEVMHYLYENNVCTQVHYIPIPLHPYYKSLGLNIRDFPNSQSYYEQALSIPLFYDLTETQQNTVIQLLKKILI